MQDLCLEACDRGGAQCDSCWYHACYADGGFVHLHVRKLSCASAANKGKPGLMSHCGCIVDKTAHAGDSNFAAHIFAIISISVLLGALEALQPVSEGCESSFLRNALSEAKTA